MTVCNFRFAGLRSHTPKSIEFAINELTRSFNKQGHTLCPTATPFNFQDMK